VGQGHGLASGKPGFIARLADVPLGRPVVPLVWRIRATLSGCTLGRANERRRSADVGSNATSLTRTPSLRAALTQGGAGLDARKPRGTSRSAGLVSFK
jgi:hypothetical protein